MAFLTEPDFLVVSRSAKFDHVLFGDGHEVKVLQGVEKPINAKQFSFYTVSNNTHMGTGLSKLETLRPLFDVGAMTAIFPVFQSPQTNPFGINAILCP